MILVVSAFAPLQARAQAGNPVVPDETECEGVPQRSLVALFTTPVPATPRADATPVAVPQVASPAGEQTGEALTKLARAVVACLNAGDFWTLITFVSDDYLLRSFGNDSHPDPLAQELSPFVNAVRGCQQCTIAPLTGDDRLGILSIGDAWLLDDGRVGYALSLATPDGSQHIDIFVAFVRSGDNWLIDQIYPLDGESTPTP